MRVLRTVSSALVAALLFWSLSCSDAMHQPQPTETAAQRRLRDSLSISEPLTLSEVSLARRAGEGSHSTALGDSEVVYVSLPPGSAAPADSVSIQEGSSGVVIGGARMQDGGFDPIALQGTLTDSLLISVTEAGTLLSSISVSIAASRQPSVVRTTPPRGKTDVALNQTIGVIFSQPLDPASITPNNFQLLLGARPVAGTIGIGSQPWLATFAPDSLLQSGSTYRIHLGPGITDIAGRAIIPPPDAEFTTGDFTGGVSGSVSGLVGQGLVLRLFYHSTVPYSGKTISLQEVAISGNGKFVFAPVDPLSKLTYGVAIAQQPHSPAQRCVVRSTYASFSIGSDISDASVVCGEFLYVANAAKNTISAFSIDPVTGALASVGTPVTAGSSPRAIVGSSDRRDLYVGNSGSNDVSEFAIDPSGGTLTPVPGSPVAAGTNPRALLLFESNYLSFESTLVVANAASNDLSLYNIDRATGVSVPHDSYATGAGPSAMVSYAGYNSVLLVAGSNTISVFGIGVALEPEPALPFPAGDSISALAFGASGNGADEFVYAANATGSAATISGFRFNVLSFYAAGAWTSLVGFPYALPSCTSIVADQSGTYLYATASTNLFGFIIDRQSGALSPLPGFPIAVDANADAVTIDPSNQFLYVRNGSAGKVTGFVLNSATGALTPMPGSPFAVGTSADFFAVF